MIGFIFGMIVFGTMSVWIGSLAEEIRELETEIERISERIDQDMNRVWKSIK